MTVRFFQDINAIDSLRSSDFDALSAYGEVIDNSIQAQAKTIKLKFNTETRSYNYELIVNVVFGDDGIGMDMETLHRCMQLGWSSRYNNRNGIGRFGVGMTLAAIHECKKIELYSKQNGKEWHYTYVDLDMLSRGEMDSIPLPVLRTPPNEHKDMVGKDSGTLVIWSKYDRQENNAAKIKEDAKIWLGRVYRYFMWEDDVSIFLNNEEIKAIDPLYARTDRTKYENDPKAIVYEPIIIDWKVDDFEAPPGTPTESPIEIKMSLLPENFRKKEGDGGSTAAKARYINMNEGISILRNKREVYYGTIPHWSSAQIYGDFIKGWPSFDNIDRFWGCEIHFDAALDRAFTVKNIKRGAIPNVVLKGVIKYNITATRNKFLEIIREKWSATKVEEKEEQAAQADDILKRTPEHMKAEKIAQTANIDRSAIDTGKNLEKETEAYIVRNAGRYDDAQKQAIKELFKSQPFTILEENWTGPQFIETSFLGGSSVLRYNMNHEFFIKVYDIIDDIDKKGSNKDELIRDLKSLLDLLLISHAKSASRFEVDAELTAEEFIQNLSASWGQYLKSYVKTWEREAGCNGQ